MDTFTFLDIEFIIIETNVSKRYEYVMPIQKIARPSFTFAWFLINVALIKDFCIDMKEGGPFSFPIRFTTSECITSSRSSEQREIIRGSGHS